MKEKEKKYWEKLRTKGMKNYILYHGVIGWGLPAAILNTFLLSYWEKRPIFGRDFIEQLIISIVIFSIGGVFFGWGVWKLTEKKYKKITENK